MRLIYIFFIALANNMDNIGVRIAYSIRGIKITTSKNLWISVITFIISSLSSFSGNIISGFLSKKSASVLSMILLVVIGLWIIIEPYCSKEKKQNNEKNPDSQNTIYNILKNPETADKDNSKDIDFKEATFLAIALSINNIGGSLSAGMIGLNSLFIGIFSAVISFLALWSGNYVTNILSKWKIGNKATVLAGVLLILIGIKQII